MASLAELGQKVKAKHPGAYDDMADDAVGRAVQAKFPGAYDDFTAAPDAAPVAPPSSPTKWSQKLGEGMLPGFNRVAAALQAATDPLIPGRQQEWGQDFGTRYGEHLRAEQGQSARTQREHPYVSAGLQTAGAIPSAVAIGAPAGALPSAAGAGAMYGAGDTRANTVGGQLLDSFIGAGAGAAGALIPSAMLAAENGVRAGVSRLMPRVTPTRSARLLMSEGVPLTVGQIAGPKTAIGQYESVSANNPLGMAGQREAAEQSFMRVAQNKGLAPGATVPTETDLQGRLGEILKGFGPAYEQIRSQPIDSSTLASLPDAASMPRKGVDARTAGGVRTEVENALSILGPEPKAPTPSGLLDASGRPIPAPPAPPRTATAGDLLKVRENIRENIRSARQAQDFDRLKLLDGAEEVVTNALEANLSPELRAHLEATDRQYARAMTAANAAPSGQTTFTPLQYLKQVERSSGKRLFKTGGAGDLQDLGEAARETFVNAPMTGVRGAVLNTIPFGHKLVGPAAAWANTPAGRAMLLRTGSPTLPFPTSVSPASGSATPSMVEALIAAMQGRGGLQILPGAAKDDRPR